MPRSKIFLLAALVWGALLTAAQAEDDRPNLFASAWPSDVQRVWAGPEYWANRLQDWRIADGRLECIFSGPDRNIHLLTRQLGRDSGEFHMRVRLNRLARPEEGPAPTGPAWVGFRFAARGPFDDYRDSLIRGQGIHAGVTLTGNLFVGKIERSAGVDDLPGSVAPDALEDLALELDGRPEEGNYAITLTATDPRTERPLARIRQSVEGDALWGNVALVCHEPRRASGLKGPVRFGFHDWQVWGAKFEGGDDQAFGPILFVQYTLTHDILKMTAQMPPIGTGDARAVRFDIRDADRWKTAGWATIDPLAFTATFRVQGWDSTRDVPYRLVYPLRQADGRCAEHEYTGTVRKDPVDKETLVVAGFSCKDDTGFPNEDVVTHVRTHDPDLMLFVGDQIYERVAGYGVERAPVDRACLDYLRKWYLWGWTFGTLTRNRPSVTIPDDHDVYHGNLWGAGGRPAERQDDGGYTMPPVWVRMVERTQTSHLPDPYDPTPVAQGIGVYYTDLRWGGVSFAILEDRKFKSSPTVTVPEGQVVNGWFQNPDFDPATQADVEEAELLGERQLRFLADWAADWSDGVWMKMVVSQTIFANVATLPSDATSDRVVKSLKIHDPDDYPPDDKLVADADSNGWPQSGRNAALREIRKAFAFHLAGDQHLPSTIHYGIDAWKDAGVGFCVPAIANLFPRRWFPPTPGANRAEGAPRYTGDFRDGFGNHVTVYAVANPRDTSREPAKLYDLSTGYGIVRLNRDARTIRVECWPRFADPRDPSTGGQYTGWPLEFTQADNYSRTPAGFLPKISVTGMTDPVVQVVHEPTGQIVYTLRIRGTEYRPMIFDLDATYTLHVGEPGTNRMQTIEAVRPATDDGKTIGLNF